MAIYWYSNRLPSSTWQGVPLSSNQHSSNQHWLYIKIVLEWKWGRWSLTRFFSALSNGQWSLCLPNVMSPSELSMKVLVLPVFACNRTWGFFYLSIWLFRRHFQLLGVYSDLLTDTFVAQLFKFSPDRTTTWSIFIVVLQNLSTCTIFTQ